MLRTMILRVAPISFIVFVAACSGSSGISTIDGNGGTVSSAEDAKRAYLGLDASIDKAITLGFDGFNAATSANIAPQTANGTAAGTLVIAGQVDQGASANKTMNLNETLTTYTDDGQITYATPATLPALSLKLEKIPNGTLSGSLDGSYSMSGALSGMVTLALTFTGELQSSAADPKQVERKPGTTHITGTATSPAGTFVVDVTR